MEPPKGHDAPGAGAVEPAQDRDAPDADGPPDRQDGRSSAGDSPPSGSTKAPDTTDMMVETRQSVVVEVRVQRKMPESYQAQLLRALERQVTRRNPLIGWSDLYPVTGPLDLAGLERFLEPSRDSEEAG